MTSIEDSTKGDTGFPPNNDSPVKRKRGRPRKVVSEQTQNSEPAKRGRPSINPHERKLGQAISMRSEIWHCLARLATEAGLSTSAYVEARIVEPFLVDNGLLVKVDPVSLRKMEIEAKIAELQGELKAIK